MILYGVLVEDVYHLTRGKPTETQKISETRTFRTW